MVQGDWAEREEVDGSKRKWGKPAKPEMYDGLSRLDMSWRISRTPEPGGLFPYPHVALVA